MEGFLNPNKVLDELELKEDMIACEFGCGSGSFTIPLAKRLKEGKVYGLDVQEEPLSALKGRTRLEGVSNIETIRCNLEEEGGSTLPDQFLDLVLIPNVLFQAEDKKTMMREAIRVLKNGGRVLVVDWKEDPSFGPKEGRISAKEAKEIAKELGLKLEKEFEAGIFHWGLIFTKP